MGRKRRKSYSTRNNYKYFAKRCSYGNYTGVSTITGYDFEIVEECLETLNRKKQFGEYENCGIIFGSQITERKIRINAISESCSIKTSAHECSCNLDIVKANQLIVEEFEKSNHTRFYLGEWHTHPEDYPSPSYQDLKSLRESYNKNKLVIPNLILMAIIGRKDICWKVYDGKEFNNIKMVDKHHLIKNKNSDEQLQ